MDTGKYARQCAFLLSPVDLPPPRLNLSLLCRLSFMDRRHFYPYMKIIHVFYENHSFYVRRPLWYTKTISEGFRYISLRVP